MAARIGEILVARGACTDEAIRDALQNQIIFGGRLGTNLLEVGAVTEEALAAALAERYRIPALHGDLAPDPAALALVKPEIADRYDVVPYQLSGRRLSILAVDPSDLAMLDEVAFAAGKKLDVIVVPEARIWALMRRAYRIDRQLRGIEVDFARLGLRGAPGGAAAAASHAPAALGQDLMDESEFDALYQRPLVTHPGAAVEAAEPAAEAAIPAPTAPDPTAIPTDAAAPAPAPTAPDAAATATDSAAPTDPVSAPEPTDALPDDFAIDVSDVLDAALPTAVAPPADAAPEVPPEPAASALAPPEPPPPPPEPAPVPAARTAPDAAGHELRDEDIQPLSAPLGGGGGRNGALHAVRPERRPEPEPSPLAFGEAVRFLEGVAERDAIARTVLRYARSRFRRAVLLTVNGGVARGWAGLGEQLGPEAVRRIHVPLSLPGIVETVVRTQAQVLGPIPKTDANVRFLKQLGGGVPANAFLVPILALGRVVNVFYADNGRGGSVDASGLGELLILSTRIAQSYEELVQRAV